MAEIEQLKKLRTDAWRTSGARFNAARRLRQRETISSTSLALFSSAIIVVSVIQSVYERWIADEVASALTVLTAAFGIFALVISLVEAGAKSGERASRLFINAEALNDFQKRLEFGELTEINAYLSEYKAIKDSLGDNHDPIDDEYFLSKHPAAPEFKCVVRRWPTAVWLHYRGTSIWHLIAIWVAFFVCLIVVVALHLWSHY